MAVKLLDAVTATGPSLPWIVRMKPRNHTVQLIITGDPTAVTLDLEGSLDGVTWAQLAEHVMSAEELAAGNSMFHVVDQVVRYVRLNLTLLTAGTAPTVTAFYAGETA